MQEETIYTNLTVISTTAETYLTCGMASIAPIFICYVDVFTLTITIYFRSSVYTYFTVVPEWTYVTFSICTWVTVFFADTSFRAFRGTPFTSVCVCLSY